MPDKWHPILAASEPEPARWILKDAYGHPYAIVLLVRRGPEIGYRADDRDGTLIGYFRTLRAACEAAHQMFIASHGPPPFQGYPEFR